MKRRNTILFIIIILLTLLLLSSCDSREKKILVLLELVANNEDPLLADVPLCGFSIYSEDKEYISDEKGVIGIYYRSYYEALSKLSSLTFPEGYEQLEAKNIQTETNSLICVTFVIGRDNQNVQPPSEEENPNNYIPYDKLSLAFTRQDSDGAGAITGYIMDIEYNPIEGVELYFGEESSYVGKTNAMGEFSLFFKNAYEYAEDKIIDFLYFVHDDYKFEVFLKPNSHSRDIQAFVVAAPKDSGFDFNTLRTNVFIKCSFHHGGVELPPGYNRNERSTYAEEGRDAIVGVEMYFNGKFISKSDMMGFSIDFLVPNTLMQLKKEGFSFILRYNMVFIEIVNDSYTYRGDENLLLEFRGKTDKMDILFED